MKDFMNNLINKIGSIPNDKILHAYVSTIICILSFLIFNYITTPFISIGAAFIFTLFIGWFKEYAIDKKLRDTYFSKGDLIADFIGILVGTLTNLWILFINI